MTIAGVEIYPPIGRNGSTPSAPSFAKRNVEQPAPPAGNLFTRMLAAKTIASIRKGDPSEVAAERWPADKLLAQVLTRAATAPAMTTVTGWAAELAQLKVVTDGLRALGSMSAAATLMQSGVVLRFDGYGTISVPGFVAAAANAGFVAEGAPIPVRSLALVPATLSPHEMASIAVLTREMAEGSNAEALIGDTLMRSAALALDAIMFDNVAGDAIRPAGLRYGVAATPASASTDAFAAFFEDVATLTGVVAQVGGAGPYALVTNPGRAASVPLRSGGSTSQNLTILGSPAVGNDVIMIALAALVAAGDDPEVTTSTASSLHMDTVPQPMGTAGPAKSMFQTDSMAIKMRWPLCWSLRDPRGVAWLTPSWK
jgi:hypothetical protein